MRRSWAASFVAILALAVVVGGCGDGSGSNSGSSSSPPSAAADSKSVEDLYLAYIAAALRGDGKAACGYLTEHGQAQTLADAKSKDSPIKEADTCEAALTAVGAFLRVFAPDPAPSVSQVKVNGDQATLLGTLQTSFGPSSSRVHLVRVEGEWKIDSDQDVESQSETVSRQTALGWPKKFCQLRIGMTRRQVRRLMGRPTQELLTGDLTQDQWHAHQFDITVFYQDRAQVTDPLDQRARQLQPDSSGQLAPEDKALFPCGAGTVFPG